jgi:RHS repeat-associated protein
MEGQGMRGRTWMRFFCLLVLLACGTLHAQDTITYVYTDPNGTPLAEADAHGNITKTYDYTPYGTVALGSSPNGPGYAGHINDPETNLSYMQARYYDSATGRFLSVDPDVPAAGNTFNFNRYGYVNNNPINHIDPNGRCIEDACIGEAAVAGCVASPACSRAVVAAGAAIVAALTVRAVHNTTTTKTVQNNNSEVPAPTPVPGTSPSAPATDGNTNPYVGPVDRPVVVVDKDGNAIPVDAGQSVNSSPNGDFQQVIGSDSKPTGDRLDRGGHPNQRDPKAREPHAHRPGVTDPTGNPHLPINQPTVPRVDIGR